VISEAFTTAAAEAGGTKDPTALYALMRPQPK
jgi:hypothetical protein